MVPVYATATEPSVLTLLLKQTQLFMRAKLNQTVGMAGGKKKTSVCEVFLSRKSLRKGGGNTAITQTQISPKNHTQPCHRWEEIPPTPMVTAPAALATQQTRAVHRGKLSLLIAENPLFIHQNTWGFFFLLIILNTISF